MIDNRDLGIQLYNTIMSLITTNATQLKITDCYAINNFTDYYIKFTNIADNSTVEMKKINATEHTVSLTDRETYQITTSYSINQSQAVALFDAVETRANTIFTSVMNSIATQLQ